MSDKQEESVATRRQAVGEWLNLASSNAGAAILLAEEEGLERQALYMTQQTMEVATKGLARGAGISHNAVRETGHDNLYLLLLAVEEIIAATDALPFVDSLLSRFKINGKRYNTGKQLRKMITLSGKPQKAGDQEREAREFFEEMLTMSPDNVGKLLGILESVDSIIDRILNDNALVQAVTSAPFILEFPSSNTHVVAIANSKLNAQVMRRLKNWKMTNAQRIYIQGLTYKVLSSMVAAKGVDQFRAEVEAVGGRFYFPKERLVRLYDVSKALTGLLVVGGLVWPHESYPRYPADPAIAHRSFQEAATAMVNKKRQLGAGHYTDCVGVIKHIRELAAYAEYVIELLQEAYASGLLFPQWDSST